MSEKVKIALVANTAWSIYNFRLGLIRNLLSKGAIVYGIAPYDTYANKLVSEGVKFIDWKLENYSNSIRSDSFSALQLYRIYKKVKFQYIFHYTAKPNIYGGIAASFTKSKSYLVVTGAGRIFDLSGFSKIVIRKLFMYASRKSQEVWFLNKEDNANFINQSFICESKAFILPSEGINTAKFLPKLNPNKKLFTRFLYAGRLLRDKGIYEYINAARIIRTKFQNVKFEIIGFTNPKDPTCITLQELEIYQSKGWIQYLGSHEDVRPYIGRCDCLIYPSYYGEGISRVLLEASSMAVPCITTDNIGCRDVVQHNVSGLIVPPKSVTHLVNAIEYFISLSLNEKIEMGINGRDYVTKNFEESKIIEIYNNKIYNEKSNLAGPVTTIKNLK